MSRSPWSLDDLRGEGSIWAMTFRIGWLSPLTPASGIGTFSDAIARHFPDSFGGKPIDLTLLHLGHSKLYANQQRCIEIGGSENFHQVLTLFDLLVYNIGNNREHHEAIYNLLRVHPGIIICHDYVYQHYLADRSLRTGGSFASYAALMTKYDRHAANDYIRRSRITSRTGQVRYSPWDSEYCVRQPMSEAILDLGSALVVHSDFAQRKVERTFAGPILRLGMPYDQKSGAGLGDASLWQRVVTMKRSFHIVSFGYIQPTKCIDLVLSAIGSSDTLKRQVRYTIAGYVGDESYYRQLRDMVVAIAIEDVVSFEINVSEARLSDLMMEADIFINLRRPNTEASSASLIEQLDVGKPVVVLHSGSFGEITPGGAIVLPADASSTDVRNALTKLVGKPELMPAIGRAGRDYARTWTCASYAEHLVRFACENRALLQRRAKVTAIAPPRQQEDAAAGKGESFGERCSVDDGWATNLARARASLRYFDRNMLVVDPEIVMSKSREDLCAYVAHVIFGIFDNVSLYRALARFFAACNGRAAYWACVRFALLADAVFAGDEAAQQRLKIMAPNLDPEFWIVIENLPPPQYFAAGCLLLARRLPRPGEFPETNADDHDGFPKRLRMAEFMETLAIEGEESDELRRWLGRPGLPDIDLDLPVLDRDVEWTMGGPSFCASVDLSGFYRLEADHVWTRGTRGFIGLRLGGNVAGVELLVSHVDACAERACGISLSRGAASTAVTARDEEPTWIALDVPRQVGRHDATTWFQLSTDRAARPPSSSDPRSLGICMFRLRVTVRAAGAALLIKVGMGSAA